MHNMTIALGCAIIGTAGLPGSALTDASAQSAGAQTPIIEIRLARETPAAGFRYRELPQVARGYFLSETAVASDSDFAQVRAYVRQNGLVLDVQFTQAGHARLSAAVLAREGSDHVGVVVNSEFVTAVRLVSSGALSPPSRLQIAVNLPNEKAHDVLLPSRHGGRSSVDKLHPILGGVRSGAEAGYGKLAMPCVQIGST
jgi:hypothetical protein